MMWPVYLIYACWVAWAVSTAVNVYRWPEPMLCALLIAVLVRLVIRDLYRTWKARKKDLKEGNSLVTEEGTSGAGVRGHA